MKPLRIKIQDEASIKKVPQHVVEKDYALSYVLAGIAQQPKLSHSLIFKGGTALKKMVKSKFCCKFPLSAPATRKWH